MELGGRVWVRRICMRPVLRGSNWRCGGPSARDAGDLALRYFLGRDRLTIETKRTVRAIGFAKRIARLSVDPRGAEHGLSRRYQISGKHGISAGTSGVGRAIDPIDGTAPNLNGLPGWCVSIGLMDDEERPVLRVICARVLDEMFVAARGLGRIRL